MFQKTTLKNGLRLILSPLHQTQVVTVLVLVQVGSRYEKKNLNGLSHFIEHMCFKGTQKRPTTLDISRALDQVGAEYNAFTTKDHTGYYIKIDQKKIELALDILSDILFNSKFAPQEIEREKRVILEEINMYEDNPLIYIEHLFEETLFQGNSLGWLVSGQKENIKRLTHQAILAYQESFYTPSAMVIGVAGKTGSHILDLIEKYFGQVHPSKLKLKSFPKFSAKFKKPRLRLKFKETEQVQIALGFPGYSYAHPDIYALGLLALILGGNMSSRLFIKVREKLGLAYFIGASLNIYQDTGNLVIQAGLDKIRLKKAIKIILEELAKIKTKGISPEELKRAQEFISGKMTLELEDSAFWAQWGAKQELLTQEILTPQEKLKKIFAVGRQDVKRVAQNIIKERNLSLALIGPFKDEAPLSKLLRI